MEIDTTVFNYIRLGIIKTGPILNGFIKSNAVDSYIDYLEKLTPREERNAILSQEETDIMIKILVLSALTLLATYKFKPLLQNTLKKKIVAMLPSLTLSAIMTAYVFSPTHLNIHFSKNS